jgi:ACS family D-galactonate transporter-like MFS transporter
MATGFEGGTARNEGLLAAGREGTPMVAYRALWAVLLLALTGPVIAWMIQDKAGLIHTAAVSIDVP